MDSQFDVESLRARLVALGRKRTRELAIQAGLHGETVDKFRRGHIAEPRLSKLQKLLAVLPPEEPKPARRKKARAA